MEWYVWSLSMLLTSVLLLLAYQLDKYRRLAREWEQLCGVVQVENNKLHIRILEMHGEMQKLRDENAGLKRHWKDT